MTKDASKEALSLSTLSGRKDEAGSLQEKYGVKGTIPDVTAGVEDMSVSPPQVSPMRSDIFSEDEQDGVDNDNNNNAIPNEDNNAVDGVDNQSTTKGGLKHSTSFLKIDDDPNNDILFVDYKDESQLDHVMKLVIQDLSEPYSIFTYRYFLHRFPELCILAVPRNSDEPIGCVVGKIDQEEIVGTQGYVNDGNGGASEGAGNGIGGQMETTIKVPTGYIGMLAVQSKYRRKGIGKALVRQVLKRMKDMDCTSVTLETEVSNVSAQRLYQNSFGFIREELLVRYYLNWGDAYRLRLWLS